MDIKTDFLWCGVRGQVVYPGTIIRGGSLDRFGGSEAGYRLEYTRFHEDWPKFPGGRLPWHVLLIEGGVSFRESI